MKETLKMRIHTYNQCTYVVSEIKFIGGQLYAVNALESCKGKIVCLDIQFVTLIEPYLN